MKTQEGRVLRVKFKPGVPPQKRFEGVVRILTDLIEDGMRDEFVRKKAVEIVNAAHVAGHDELGEIKAITKWVQTNMIYRKDGFGVEWFHTARRLIKDIEKGQSAGDCDDFVILGGALLGALGYPVGALIVDSNNDGVFNHVMLVTKTFGPTKQFGRNWIPIELIYPQFELGESVPVSKVYPLMANAKTLRAPIMKKSIRGIAGIGSSSGLPSPNFPMPIKKRSASETMTRQEIMDKHPPGTDPAHIDVMKTYMDSGMTFTEAHNAANKAGFLPKLIKAHPYYRILGAILRR